MLEALSLQLDRKIARLLQHDGHKIFAPLPDNVNKQVTFRCLPYQLQTKHLYFVFQDCNPPWSTIIQTKQVVQHNKIFAPFLNKVYCQVRDGFVLHTSLKIFYLHSYADTKYCCLYYYPIRKSSQSFRFT